MESLFYILNSLILGYGLSTIILVPFYFLTRGNFKIKLNAFLRSSIWLIKWIGVLYILITIVGIAQHATQGFGDNDMDDFFKRTLFTLVIPVFTQLLWIKSISKYKLVLFVFAIPLAWFSALFLGELMAAMSILHFDYLESKNKLIAQLILNYSIKVGGFCSLALLGMNINGRLIKNKS